MLLLFFYLHLPSLFFSRLELNALLDLRTFHFIYMLINMDDGVLGRVIKKSNLMARKMNIMMKEKKKKN